MRPVLSLVLCCALAPAAGARSAEPAPADSVLRLVPADAAATLVVTDLRGHARELSASRLLDGLAKLPAVQAWLAGDQAEELASARREIEAALGTSLATVRDDLLGDAVALCLRLPPGATPEQAEGMLLSRVRAPDTLRHLIARTDELERAEGILVSTAERRHRSIPYTVRTFRPGTRPGDVYALLGDDLFAWSNSEPLLRSAIDRHLDGGGLSADPRFRKVRAALPARSLAALYVDPGAVGRIAEAAEEDEPPADDRAGAMLRRYLEAVEYAGAALEWRGGLVLHVHEALDPAKLDEPIRRWAAHPGGPSGLARRVPPSAPLLAAGHADLSALGDLALALVPEADRGRAENVLTAVRGIFLGLDLREEVLPRLGPQILAYVDAPVGGSSHWPVVVALGFGGSPEDSPSLSAAIDNALRTLLALMSLDEKAATVGLRVASREVRGVRVTSLVGGPEGVSYAVGRDFVAIGTTAEAVAAFAGDEPAGGSPRLERLRAEFFPTADTYACADLEALRRLAETHRESLAARLAEGRGGDTAAARRDLDGALALVGLFRAAFATSRLEPDATAAHRTLGLIVRTDGRTP